MEAMSRKAILSRYRDLRAINARHQTNALKFLSGPTVLELARRIGLKSGKAIVASEEEMPLLFDLGLYTASPGRSRGIERYARSQSVDPESDEGRVLAAMLCSRFSLWQVERRHETAGLVMRDTLRDESVWLVDESMERTVPVGAMLAFRIITPEDFAMTCGAFVPVDIAIADELDRLPSIKAPEMDDFANDRRVAITLYRAAVRKGAMDRVGFVSPGESPW